MRDAARACRTTAAARRSSATIPRMMNAFARRQRAKRRSACAASMLILLLGGCGDRAAIRHVALQECRLAKLASAAQCATVEVPEDRSKPEGRKLALSVALLPANTLSPDGDPLFMFAGGPGQSAEALVPVAIALAGVRRTRDIVLIDPRGAGKSSPLKCAALAPRDPFEELIDLWGGSYGTRVAQEFARRYPARVRSMVLDGVAPPATRITLDIWPAREAAFAEVLAACNESAACKHAYPNLNATLAQIKSALGASRKVTIADPRTGAPREVPLSFDDVV